MATNGRPRKEIDKTEFEKLCHMQCTKLEIAAWFDMHDDTLEERIKEIYSESFSAVYAKKKGKGKIALRRSQLQMSEKSPAMAIFLGKNYLGQSDKVETDNTHKGKIELAYSLDDEPEE